MAEKDEAPRSEKCPNGQTALKKAADLPLPPAGFDPMTASAQALAKYRLPPRPDPNRQPHLYEAFAKLFSSTPTFVNPNLAPDLGSLLTKPPKPVIPVVTPSRFEDSPNWCGAYIEPSDSNLFVQLTGAWTVPTPTLPPPIDQVVPGATGVDYECSTWIGLDGQRRYFNSSLPQIGTAQDLSIAPNGSQRPPIAQAWFQWFERGQPKLHRRFIKNVPVAPGDRVICMLWVVNPTTVIAFIRNVNTGKIAHFRRRAPLEPISVGSGVKTRPTISGATAEWIMERPAVPKTPDRFPYPAYNPTTFDVCIAGAARGPGAPMIGEVLEGARFIRMFEVRSNPTRTAFISMPAKIGDTSFSVSYGGFGG